MEHEIIMDLLPLYHDGVCSEQSCRAVEEHLKECEKCQKALADMDAPLPEEKKTAQLDREMVEKLSNEWKKDRKKAICKGAILASTVCLLIAGILGGRYLTTVVPLIPYGAEEVEVKDLCQLKDGRLWFRLQAEDGKRVDFADYDFETLDGQLLMTPKRTILEHPNPDALRGTDFLVDLAEHNAWNAAHGDSSEAHMVYLGTKDDFVLIWKEGMVLPSASPLLEAEYGCAEE